jgi:hypothetical protein
MLRRRIPLQASVDVAALTPSVEATLLPWRGPAELKAKTIEQVRAFLRGTCRWGWLPNKDYGEVQA